MHVDGTSWRSIAGRLKPPARRIIVGVFFGYWLGYGLLLTYVYVGYPFLDLRGAALSAGIDVVSLMCVWFAAWAVADRLPLSGPSAFRNLALTVAVACVVLIARIAALRAVMMPLGWFAGSDFVDSISVMMPRGLAAFSIFWTGGWALAYYRRAVHAGLRAATLRLRLVDVQLRMVTARLHPHFVGNALNAIAALMDESPPAARAALAQLRQVMDSGLRHTTRHEVRLQEELQFVESWLQIQKYRYGDRLAVDTSIDDAALNAWVPTLILQPIVENVVKHAVDPTNRTVHLKVEARIRGAALILNIEDDGPGVARTEKSRPGIGLSSTSERLALLYDRQARLIVGGRPGGGTLVRVELPFLASPLAGDVLHDHDGLRRAPMVPQPAARGAIMTAVLILLAATVSQYTRSVPLEDMKSYALVGGLATVELALILLPAAFAFWLPRRLPASEYGRWVAVSVAAVVLALSALATTFAMTTVTEWVAGISVAVPLALLSSASAWGTYLNVLAAGYAAEHIALMDTELQAAREAATAHRVEEKERAEVRGDIQRIFSSLDRIEACLDSDVIAAQDELAELGADLRRAHG